MSLSIGTISILLFSWASQRKDWQIKTIFFQIGNFTILCGIAYFPIFWRLTDWIHQLCQLILAFIAIFGWLKLRIIIYKIMAFPNSEQELLAQLHLLKQEFANQQPLLASIVENCRDFIGVSTLDGQMLFLNYAGQQMVGLDGIKSVNKTQINDYFMLKDQLLFKNHILPQVLAIGHWQQEINFQNFITGKRIPVLAKIFLIKDLQTGKNSHIAIIGSDLTKLKQTEAELRVINQEMAAIIQTLPDVLFCLDKDGIILDYKVADPANLYLKPEQFLGRNLAEILPPDVLAKYRTAIAQVSQTQKLVTIEYDLRIGGIDRGWEEARLVPLGNNQIIVVIRQISDRKMAEEALRYSEERYRRIVETAAEGIWRLDSEQKTNFVNDKMAAMLGYTIEEMLGRSIYEFMDEASRVIAQKNIEICRQGIQQPNDYKFRRQDGSDFWAIISCSPILDITGQYIGSLSMITDITDRKLAEEELAQKEAQNRAIIEAIPDLLLRVKRDGSCLNFIPPKDASSGQYLPIMTNLAEVLPPDKLQKQLGYIEEALNRKEVIVYEHELFKYGKLAYEEVRISPSGEDQALIIVRDISKRKYAEAQIQASLQEKEVLLKEIHHRVKNNLHVIDNLLDLQADSVQDPKVLDIFADSQNRIYTMALIHEQLYQSPNLAFVDFGEYIHRLVGNLCTSFGSSHGKIQLTVEAVSLPLNLETAIPCGLLINELVTNAYKHAFPDGRFGEVKVQISEDKNQQLHLLIADNGIGIPATVDWQNSTSLGLKLVQILAKQLRAKLELTSNCGTSVHLTFSQLQYKPRL